MQLLSEPEVRALLGTWDSPSPVAARNRAMVWLMYRYGVKAGELRAMGTWDYDPDSGVLTVPATKYGRGRRQARAHPLDPFARRLVETWLLARSSLGLGPNPPLFCTLGRRPGGLVNVTSVLGALNRARTKAGVARRVTTEGLRRSGADYDVREAALRALGHERAQRHLEIAWRSLHERDSSSAYREAVRAVEAAAKPVILPTSNRATLGTMIAALGDKPEKWRTTLGTVDLVRGQMASVWTGQLDRHGTDDESIPLTVSQEEADAAVHVCIALVRLFVGGHVRRT